MGILCSSKKKKKIKEIISCGYFQLIRNYYKFGWIISYLFGSTPNITDFLLDPCDKKKGFFLQKKDFFYLPYSTSLRISEFGYTNKNASKINITFNNLEEYLFLLKKAISTSHADYENIGIKKHKKYLQISTNILQNENELYTLIRPKVSILKDENFLEVLKKKGIEYVEIRSLDINPFSPIGITEEQIVFLDLFLIWCVLFKSPSMNAQEIQNTYEKKWKKIIFFGRDPKLDFFSMNKSKDSTNNYTVKKIFTDLLDLAEILDEIEKEKKYKKICRKFMDFFFNRHKTYSARFLEKILKYGFYNYTNYLAKKYKKILSMQKISKLSYILLKKECIRSVHMQKKLETSEDMHFEKFLQNYLEKYKNFTY
ncbi:hypothetical protein AOQ89_02865 [bacterium endosymbiont of Pedicinus badii]|nr:hypothetical protein [bacterium endosymbiont of Pedicinus badii]OQM34247.1 hypothetical protein AOQ89_02865 [bacterium endosymbiont of Pedicinus badii]